MLHFLANINHDSWTGHIGSYILLSFGPTSAAKIQESLVQLRTTPHAKAFELEPAELVDFTARQVFPQGEDSDLDEVTELFERAQDSDNPVLVPERLVAELLELADDDDNNDLKISRLPLYQQGTLECVVNLANMFDGRGFLLDGGIDLERLKTVEAGEA